MLTYKTILAGKLIISLLIIIPVNLKAQSSSSRIIKEDGYNIMVQLFNDPDQKLQLSVYDTINNDENSSNTVLTYSRSGKVIFRDSLYCQFLHVEFNDLNNDRIKDIQILHTSSARSCQSFYVYVIDNANKKPTRIKGTEIMLDPMLDTRNNIIVSTARYGKLYYSFYRISPKKKLINLGHDFEGEWNDSTDKYNKAIRLIKQHDRKVKY